MKIIITLEVTEEEVQKQLQSNNMTREQFLEMMKSSFREELAGGFDDTLKATLEVIQ